jgi:hypothetical protein
MEQRSVVTGGMVGITHCYSNRQYRDIVQFYQLGQVKARGKLARIPTIIMNSYYLIIRLIKFIMQITTVVLIIQPLMQCD